MMEAFNLTLDSPFACCGELSPTHHIHIRTDTGKVELPPSPSSFDQQSKVNYFTSLLSPKHSINISYVTKTENPRAGSNVQRGELWERSTSSVRPRLPFSIGARA